MATRKEIEDAAAEVAEPVAAQIAALRADMAELGALVSRIGKQRAAGLKSAATRDRGGRLRQGRGGDRRGAGRASVARGRAGRGHPAAALRLARPRGAPGLSPRRFLPAVSVARLFATVSRVAEARVRNIGRRASRRAGADRRLHPGRAPLPRLRAHRGHRGAGRAVRHDQRAGDHGRGGAGLLLLLLAALAWEDRRHRRLAARRAALDRELARAAALSLVGDARPSRPVVGLGLVAIGALMVLLAAGSRLRRAGGAQDHRGRRARLLPAASRWGACGRPTSTR